MIIYNFKVNGSKIFKIFAIIISIIVISIFIFTIHKIFGTAKQEGEYDSPNNLSNISDDNYTNILKTVHENLDDYVGKKINFSGYVYRIYDFNDNQFVLAREMIISSDNHAVVVGFLSEYEGAGSFNDGAWVEAEGVIEKGYYHGDLPVIKIKNIKETTVPRDEFVYPPDDSYVSSEI